MSKNMPVGATAAVCLVFGTISAVFCTVAVYLAASTEGPNDMIGILLGFVWVMISVVIFVLLQSRGQAGRRRRHTTHAKSDANGPDPEIKRPMSNLPAGVIAISGLILGMFGLALYVSDLIGPVGLAADALLGLFLGYWGWLGMDFATDDKEDGNPRSRRSLK